MKKLLFLAFLLSFAALPVHGQKRGQPRIDSLVQLIKPTTIDTHQARVLIDLCFTFNTIDPDKGIDYGKQGLALSEQLSWKAGMSDAHRAIGVNLAMGKSQFRESLDPFAKALEIAEAIGDKGDAAKLYNNMGVVYWYLSDFTNAIEHYFKAFDIHESMNNKEEMAIALSNIGLIYSSQDDFPKALEYLVKGNQLDEAIGNKPGVASNLGNIGYVYAELGDLDKALEFDSNALVLYTELGDKHGIARNLGNMGGIYAEKGLHRKALENYTKALAIGKEMGSQIVIAANQGAIAGTYLRLVRDNDDESLDALFNGNANSALQKANLYTDSAIAISQEINDMNALIALYDRKSEIQMLSGDFRGALESYKLYAMSKDSVFSMEKNKKLTEAALQYEFDKKQAQAEAEQAQKDIRNRAVRNSILAGLIAALIFSGVVIRQRIRIGKEKKISDIEKRRSDELLLNILPEEVADELKATGAAKAKAFTMVTVMMTDFKDFTTIAEKVSAELLVAEIHHCFSAFDNIIHKHKIEKIKTIGDAYLCASGLPVSNYSHATEILDAAMEIRAFMEKRKAEKIALGEIPFDIRIGVHTGPVVAGIVGVKKYAYDIWGDTVNLAARMEQHGEPGKINISQHTYELVKDKFDCTYRGKIEAKHKGEVSMYFAEPAA
jgi:adenylate cyclase